MTSELWSDERIDQEVLSKIDELLQVDGDRENDTGLLTASSVDRLMRAIRHDYQQRIAELHEEYEGRHYKTCLYYVKFIVNLRKENDRLRALLPDAETRRDIREWANEHSSVRAALVLAWLQRLETPP